MKTRIRLICLSLTLVCQAAASGMLLAQVPYGSHLSGGSIQPAMAADLPFALPGRVWVQANLADQGLGYQGSYFTIGGKTHLGEDFLEGRWLLESRSHVSVENFGLFSNIGIERVFSVPAAGADVSSSVWFDYDADRRGDFAHTFYQVGVSGSIKTRRWDVYGNGYFPVGTTTYTQGDPTGEQCFFGNNIVLLAGLDTALRGFDAMFRWKPESWAFLNGHVGVGGYAYEADFVDFFGGVRVRTGAQLLRGLMINAEVNHDSTFDWTGVLQLTMMFGANARGTEYGLLGCDLNPTVRNDHIVRFRRDIVLAIDPDTGLPYTVWHVDNTNEDPFATGTFENPFPRLRQAELASAPEHIIFVRPGDGTTTNYDEGITLQDGQMLLGSGVQHLIPVQGGVLFELCNPQDGNLPRITNRFGGPAITLANRNTVRGFIIDGSQGGLGNGIQGVGFPGNPLNSGIIEDVTILGDPVLNGIFLNNVTGSWRFARNNISTAGFDGIFIGNLTGANSQVVFEDNVITNNGRDGIHMQNYDGALFRFQGNEIGGNDRSGIRMQNYLNTAGTGGAFEFFDNNIFANEVDGIAIINADGNFQFVNNVVNGNFTRGIHLMNVTNTNANHLTLIENNLINNNGVGAGAGIHNNLMVDGGRQRLLITGNNLDNNGVGVLSRAAGVGTILFTDVIDNVSISNNQSDGLRFISQQGASHFVRVENTGAPLPMLGNGAAGRAITFLTGDDSGGLISSLNGIVRNVNIVGTPTGQTANGIFGSSQDDGQLTLILQDILIQNIAGTGMLFNIDTNPTLAINTVQANNVSIIGTAGNGISINTGTDTYFDFVLLNSVLSNGATGINIAAAGNAANPFVDNRTRVLIRNVSVTDYLFNGINIAGSGDAHLLVNLDSNVITDNGPGLDDGDLPYFHGVNVTATGQSEIYLRLTNNLIARNFEQGVNMTTIGGGQIVALLENNNISGNDIGEGGDPPANANITDMVVTNNAAGSIELAMSNNFFQLPVFLINNGAILSFVVELDGLTNGPAPIIFFPNQGAFTILPYGTLVEARIQAEEAAFEAAGFPPQN